MKTKVYQLVEHKETPFLYYGIHEALLDKEQIYWVGSKAIRKYDDYHEAVEQWAKMEPKSSFLDIISNEEAEQYYDKVDYSDIEELDFND